MSVDHILIHPDRMERLREQHHWSLEHEGVLGTVFCLIGLCEGPVTFHDKVIAAFMNTSERKWLSYRDDLIKAGILYITEEEHLYVRGEGQLFKFPTKGRGSLPTQVREAANRRANSCCTYCGTLKGPFHHDHLLPYARGGSNDSSNIVLACRSCNISKGDKTLIEWVAFLRNREVRQ